MNGSTINQYYSVMTDSGKTYPLLRVRKEFASKLGLGNFPNFHASGSVTGMKKQFYGKSAQLVRCGQYIYNVTPEVYEEAKLLIRFRR